MNFKTPDKFLFKEGLENFHLHALFTRLGRKTVYDSAAQCNKCAYCSRVCPAQLQTGKEDCGPRARNILLRLIMENKIGVKKNIAQIKNVLSGCMLCGACTKECFAKVPAHEHVLELERTFGNRKLPWFYRLKNKIIQKNPFGLKQKIKKINLNAENAGALFLPSYEAKFLEVKSALNMLRAATKNFNGVKILWGGAGMYEYVYGTLPAARTAALKLMSEYFDAPPGGKKIITDSLDIFNFVKKYPQIFFDTEHFDRAQKFAENIFFIADILPKPRIKIPGKIIFSKTAAFCAEDEIFAFAKDFPSWIGENYPIPPLGYEYIKPKECRKYLLRKIEYIKAAKAGAVVVPTLSQKRLLNKCLKKYYPECKAIYTGDFYAD